MRYAQLFLLAAVLCLTSGVARAQTYVTPMLGGGQVFADMVHIDIYYDMAGNQLHATVDDSFGTPVLRALDPGLAFDPAKPFAVLNGKPYNSQYGWNVGGFYSLPPGSAIWIELIRCSAILECYSGYGSAGSYVPIFGTAGSTRLWKWSGVMVHNTYAVTNPPVSRVYADYHMFFGDAQTGSRANFMDYDTTTARLEWDVEPVDNPLTLRFGALDQTNGAPLCFLNADRFVTNSGTVMNFRRNQAQPAPVIYEASPSLMAVPATALNGGPHTNSAAIGACLELELVSLTGPPQGRLELWEPGASAPSFQLPAGQTAGTNRIRLTENFGAPDGDPYGCFPRQRLTLNQPGLYCLGLRARDASINGPLGGPIHAQSEVAYVYLQAGLTISALIMEQHTAVAQFGGEPGRTYHLERRTSLNPTATWQTVAGPLIGTNALQTLTDPTGGAAENWFRIRAQ